MLFLQTLAVKARLPAGSKQLITSLLQQTPYAYESSSGGVIEMLEKLKEQFYEERNTLEKEEMNGRHAYDMEALTLTDSIKAADKDLPSLAQKKVSLSLLRSSASVSHAALKAKAAALLQTKGAKLGAKEL